MTITRRAMAAGLAAFSLTGLSRTANAQSEARACKTDFKRTVTLPYDPPGTKHPGIRMTLTVGVSYTKNPYTDMYPGDGRHPRFYMILNATGLNASHDKEEILFPHVLSMKPAGRQFTLAQLPLPPDHPDHNPGPYAIGTSPDQTALAFYRSEDKEKRAPYARYEVTPDGFSMFYQSWGHSLTKLRTGGKPTYFLNFSGNRYDPEVYDNFYNRPEYKVPKYALNEIDKAIKQVAQDYYEERFVNKPNGTCSENCYVSTAACGAVGLNDDCWELSQLRRFRDNWLSKQANGADDIARYYALAPRFTENVLSRAIFSRLGLKRLAYNRYRRMMARLTKA